MLEFWYNAEPIQKIMYIIILVCILLLFLSIYKIWRWFQRENVVGRFRQHREYQRENVFYELHNSISRARLIWFCAGCAAIIALSIMLAKGWQIIGLIVGVVLLYLVNNWIVASRWRCLACHERLPCLVGRSALRPKWTECCLHCGYSNSQDASSKEHNRNG